MINFIDYLEENLSTERVSGDTQILIHDDCPFCGGSGGRIYVDVKKQIGIDHKCGKGFRPVEFVMAHESCSYKQAIDLLNGTGSRYVSEAEEVKEKTTGWWPQTVPLTAEATAYMAKRGFDERFCQEAGLLSCLVNTFDGERTHYTANRIIIPVYRQDGLAIGWQARDITGKAYTKYIIQPGFQAAETLYNIHRIKPGIPLIIAEGVMDAWGWMKAGFENVVATWGKKASAKQIELIWQLQPSEVLAAWDGDAVAESFSLEERCSHLFDMKVVNMGENDADELTREQLAELYNTAKAYTWEEKIEKLLKM